MKNDGIPIGLSMALAQNPEAIKKFAILSEKQQKEIIEGTHSIKSKEEMQRYVNEFIIGAKTK